MEKSSRNWERYALFLIDVQRDFWSEEKARQFPGFAENILRLLDLCRKEGIEVIHLRASFRPDMSDWMPNHRLMGRIPCVEGTDGVETLPFAVETGSEAVIIKKTYDGFHSPDLMPYLTKRGKRFLLTAGLVTSICVLLTTLSATQLGFLTAVVEDCCADEPRAHKRTLDRYEFVFERTRVRQITKRYSKWNARLEKLGQGEKAA
jgi:nicotinamidase-related amidase